jgi:exodeoxyribonuclease VII small subunit
MTEPADNLTYEQAREELTEVVRQLEAGGVPLETSLALWERGEQLARICESWLEGAKSRIEKVMADEAEETPES